MDIPIFLVHDKGLLGMAIRRNGLKEVAESESGGSTWNIRRVSGAREISLELLPTGELNIPSSLNWATTLTMPIPRMGRTISAHPYGQISSGRRVPATPY